MSANEISSEKTKYDNNKIILNIALFKIKKNQFDINILKKK